MNDLLQDVKFGVRVLARNPLLTFVAAFSLALGVAANTTVFTLVKAVFLEPLPVNDISRLVSVFRQVDSAMAGASGGGFIETSFANYEDLRDRSQSFEELAASTFGAFNLSSGGEPEQVFGSYATTNYFSALGVEPVHGRVFSAADEREFVAVLAHGLWERRFGADTGVVGETLRINGRPFTVIGIAPPGFKGLYTLANQELWIPVQLYPQLNDGLFGQALTHRGLRFFNLVGRLAPGVERGAAEAEAKTIASGLEKEHPDWNRDRSFSLLPLDQAMLDPNQRSQYVRAGGLLMGAVGLVLAIACANVASLLLSRSRSRRREIAMRLSLGATRGRLMRQLLTEASLLALAGGAMGVVIALWTRPLLWRLRPPFLPEGSLDLGLDLNVLAFTAVVALVAGLLFGMAPAWQSSRVDLVTATKERDADTYRRTRAPMRQAIVAGQAALSLLTLAAAGLFVASLMNAYEIDPGFDHERLAVASFDLGAQNYSPDQSRRQFERILEATATLPGVESVSFAASAPLSFPGSFRVIPQGAGDRVGSDGVYISNTSVTPDYFATMGVAPLEGRLFDDRDAVGTQQVMLVNRTFAETFWPGESALGRQVIWPAADGPWDIIGVVPDMKYTTLGEDPAPYFYRPLSQQHSPGVTLHVRAAAAPDVVLPTVLEELRRLDPELPITNAITLQEALRRSLWAAHMGATLLSIFGLLAVSLAAVGIYGVLAHVIESRRREIGIRMALGARPRLLVSQLLRQGLWPVWLGLALGSLACLLTLRFVGNLLYGLSGTEPSILLGAAGALAVVALLACIVPALRAMRIDPVQTLKVE